MSVIRGASGIVASDERHKPTYELTLRLSDKLGEEAPMSL